MSEPLKDGGPAFPLDQCWVCADYGEGNGLSGMTLRDYFAAAALTGAMANPEGYSPPWTDEDFVPSENPDGPGYRKSAQGVWCYVSNPSKGADSHTPITTYEDRLARCMYTQADAMLKAREQ